MTNPSSPELFHSGIVVGNLESAMRALSLERNLHWTPVAEVSRPVRLESGAVEELSFRLVYSIEGPHHLELVEEMPGTLWTTSGGPAVVHHFGYWSNDLEADGAELERQGAVAVAVDVPESGEPVFRYHRSALGFYIELVAARMQPRMEAMWA